MKNPMDIEDIFMKKLVNAAAAANKTPNANKSEKSKICVDMSEFLRLKVISNGNNTETVRVEAFDYMGKTWEVVGEIPLRSVDVPKFISAVERLGKLMTLT